MDKLIILCPHCKKEIDLLAKEQEESKTIASYKQHLKENVHNEIEKKIKEQLQKEYENKLNILNANFEKTFLEKEKELNKSKQNELDKLNKLIINLENDLKNKDENKLKDIEIEKNKITEEKNKEIVQLNETISSLQNEIKNKDEQKNNAIDLAIKDKEKEIVDLKFNHSEILRIKENEIAELKSANEKQKIINNKIKGENWEKEVEGELRKHFSSLTEDVISKITKQGEKADYLQVVKDKDIEIGKIVYECKNGDWKENWEDKLFKDMINEKANYAILVATSTEDKFKVPFLNSSKNKNIFISGADHFIFVASIVRKFIVIENNLKAKSQDQNTFDKFNDWKKSTFEKCRNTFEKSIKSIEDAEKAIINKVENISKNRKDIYELWQKSIVDFIDNFNF